MTQPQKNSIVFKVFRGSGQTSWDKLLTAAAEFATSLEAGQLVNISHSSDSGSGTVVVWYFKEAAPPKSL